MGYSKKVLIKSFVHIALSYCPKLCAQADACVQNFEGNVAENMQARCANSIQS